MVAIPPLFLFISCFGVPELRIELGAALQQQDALPVGYVTTSAILFMFAAWRMADMRISCISNLSILALSLYSTVLVCTSTYIEVGTPEIVIGITKCLFIYVVH